MNPSSSGVSLASDCRESPGADLRGMNVVGLAGEKIFFYNHSAAVGRISSACRIAAGVHAK